MPAVGRAHGRGEGLAHHAHQAPPEDHLWSSRAKPRAPANSGVGTTPHADVQRAAYAAVRRRRPTHRQRRDTDEGGGHDW